MTAIIDYPTSMKRQIVDLVEHLAKQCKRPICTADLKEYYQEHPECRTFHRKRLGQVLIGCSRPCLTHPYLQQIGIFRGYAYYAPEKSTQWFKAFNRFVARSLWEELDDIPMGTYSHYLTSRSDPTFSDLGARALVLYAQEDKWLRHCIQTGKTPYSYLGKFKVDESQLWDRQKTKAYLENEFARRTPFAKGIHRILRNLRWPQSCLYQQATSDPLYLADQVKILPALKFPDQLDDTLLPDAVFCCLRYA